MSGEHPLDRIESANTEHHIPIELGLTGQQVGYHLLADHLFMDGIRFDVLAVEVDARKWSTNPVEALNNSLRSRR